MATVELSYCASEVRRHDHDRFLVCLLAPAAHRESLFALHAFNLEIARTREVITEPLIGQMRLQWWRDGIAAAFDPSDRAVGRAHGVLQPLAAAIRDYRLTQAEFERLIDAREADLVEEGPANLVCLVNYAEVTGAPLVRLGLEILGVRSEAASEAARAIGIAWALTGLLRAVPFHARQRRLYLPADRLAAHGIRRSQIFDGKAGPALRPVAAEVAAVAREHLARARAVRRSIPAPARPVLRLAILTDLYLGTLAAEGHDVFAPRVGQPHPFGMWGLVGSRLTGRY